MKKQILNLWTIAMLGIVTILSSCSNDDVVTPPAPTPEPTKATTYTVMLYGCGGGDLDASLEYNLQQLEAAGKQARINFAGLIKFSQSYQQVDNTAGTRFLTMTEEGLKNEKKYEASFRMDNPENLTNFIKETKEKMPADKYILVFWNHGAEFGFGDKPAQSSYPETTKSRGVLFDDNTGGTGMSTYEIEKGIKDSGTKLDLIYLDLCNMGMVETYYQLKDCAHYIMGATQPTPGFGGNYTQLMNDLQNKDSLEEAIQSYVPKCVQNWTTNGEDAGDLECYDMTYMDELMGHVKSAVNQLTKDRDANVNVPEGLDDYDPRQQTKLQWYMQNDKLFIAEGSGVSADMSTTFTRLAGFLSDGKLSSYATLIENTIEKMTIAHSNVGLPTWMQRMSMGITWPTNNFNSFMHSDIVYQKAIEQSAFLQASGWGKYLSTCKFPQIFKIKSIYFNDNNIVYGYEGEQSPIDYEWSAEVTVSEEFEQNTEVAQILDEINEDYNKQLKNYRYVLRHGRGIVEDMYDMIINNNYGDFLKSNNVNKIHITASLLDEVDSEDPDADKYHSIVEEDFELE